MIEDRSDELCDWYAEDHIDGAELLDELRATLTRYVVFPSEHAAAAVTLWIAATHTLPASECAPRLVITSPEKRCAKTRLLDIIAGTCHKPLATSDATVAAIFRSLGGDHPPTLLVDEADAMFGNRKVAEQNEDFRKLLNARPPARPPSLAMRRSAAGAHRVLGVRYGRDRGDRRHARHHHRSGREHHDAPPLQHREGVEVPVTPRRSDPCASA
jgi:hypothetical protein